MSAPAPEPGSAGAAGFGIRQTAALCTAAVVTRGELAALELTEAREHAARWVALALAAAVLLLAALLVASLLVVSLFWDSHRFEAIAAVALAYALGGAGLARSLAASLRSAPPLLQSTMAVLRADCEALRQPTRRPA